MTARPFSKAEIAVMRPKIVRKPTAVVGLERQRWLATLDQYRAVIEAARACEREWADHWSPPVPPVGSPERALIDALCAFDAARQEPAGG